MKFLFTIVVLFAFKLTSLAQVVQRELKANPSLIVGAAQKASEASPVTIHMHCGGNYHNRPLPLLIVNGKRRSFDSLKNFDVNLIASISVMKGNEATQKYGRKAKNGVIIITLKKNLINYITSVYI